VARAIHKTFRVIGEKMSQQALSVNKLMLSEWRFGITAANKEMKDAGSTFLQLKLLIDRGDGESKEEFVGMSFPVFICIAYLY
jgi:hypothetical protein